MAVFILLGFVYLVGIVGIVIMKKLQPWNRIYSIWVAAVCILLTLFVTFYVF